MTGFPLEVVHIYIWSSSCWGSERSDLVSNEIYLRLWLLWTARKVRGGGDFCGRSFLAAAHTCTHALTRAEKKTADRVGPVRHRVFATTGVSSSAGTRYTLLIRETIVNRTYGTHKNLYTSLYFLTIFDPV